MEEVLTPEQVGKLLKVHTYTVLKYIKEGKIKALKLGRVYRIKSEDVFALLEGRTNDHPAAEKEKIPPRLTGEKPHQLPSDPGHYVL